MDTLSSILGTFRLDVDIINNAQYCGDWAIDTSGSRYVSFHIVTHGQCYVSSDCMQETQALGTGDLVLFPHDNSHTMTSQRKCSVQINAQSPKAFKEGLQSDGVGLLCGYFRFTHPANNPLLDVLPNVLIKRQADLSASCPIANLLLLIQSESLNQQPGYQAALNRLTESLFVLLVREYFDGADKQQGLAAALSDGRIKNVLDALHDRPEQRWTLDDMASVAAMSRSAFAALFKSLLNESAMEYLTRWRMQNAWLWLQEEGETVFAVAQRCGYDTEAAFAKAFKRVIGMGPGAARKAKP